MSPPSDAAPRPESAPPLAPGVSPDQPAEDELPDWEPLTPELVEDEAIRGDAMLRHSVLLLAILLSWTQISDTSLLVRIRSGEYMARHGVLPPRTDPFSVSAEGREWINLGWLSDLALSGLNRVGLTLGDSHHTAKVLTLWGVFAGLLTFWVLSRVSISKLPTWWSSIAVGLAVVAAFPALTAGPASITLLGTALLLWLLHRSSELNKTPSLVGIGLLFTVWGNLDPAAWVGLALLWSAGIGRFLTTGDRLGASAGSQTSLVKAAAVATVAALIHPFHWHVLEAPVVLFQTELPEARLYGSLGPYFRWMLFSANEPGFWMPLDWPVVAGVLLFALTLVTLLLNSKRVPLTHVLLFIVANALAFRAGLLLPVASIVNAALAGLNGQAWYVRTFRQEYSVAWTELLYSRTGRAVTVLGLFTLAYLMINGALPGVSGRRLGMGFDWRIKTATISYLTLAEQTKDVRAFNGRPDHGDLMIWTGFRPFNDSRLALFARGKENLLQLHRETFFALQVEQEGVKGTGKPEVWKATLDRFQIQQVYARLTGDDGAAKYRLLQRLMLNPELKLAAIDAAAARLDRADAPTNAATPGIVPQVGIDFIQQVFRGPDNPVTDVPAWPRELTTYERWLIQPEPSLPLEGQLSQHFAFLADELAARLPPASKPGETSHALRIRAIQLAWRSLYQDANTPQVHRVLRSVYRAILGGEQGFGQFGTLNELRVRQLLAAEYFSLLTSAAGPVDHEQLAYALYSVGYRDVALEHLQAIYAATGSWTAVPRNDANFAQARNENQALLKQLEQAVKEVQTNAQREIHRGEDPIAVAKMAFDAGCPRLALTLLEPMETQIIQDPMAAILHAQVLMAVGRIEESWERLEGIEALFPADGANAPGAAELKSIWRSNTAIANMVRGDVQRAVDLWHEEAQRLSTTAVRGALDNAPLATAFPARLDLLAYVGGRIAADTLFTFPERWSGIQTLIAVSDIEHGRLSNARRALKLIFDDAPRATIRPLAAYYYRILTGEDVSPQPPPADIEANPPQYLDNGAIAPPITSPVASQGGEDVPPPPPMAVPLNTP